MPRIPCVVCRTTISTPVKFLLQCSCGFGLHHTCIVPIIPKKLLLLMIEASMNGHHSDTLSDSWQCPGCKATEQENQGTQEIRNHIQLHTPQILDAGIPVVARIDVNMMHQESFSLKRHTTDPSHEPPENVKFVKHPLHPLVQTQSVKGPIPLIPPRVLDSSSTNTLRVISCCPRSEHAITSNTDGRQTTQRPSSKVLLAHNTHVPQPSIAKVIDQSKLRSITDRNFQDRLNTPAKLEAGILTPTFTNPISNLPPAEDNGTFVLSSDRQKSLFHPPLLDLRKLLKRKRPCVTEASRQNNHTLHNDNFCESPSKKRRLHNHKLSYQEAALPKYHPQLETRSLVANSSRSPHRMDVIQIMETPSFVTTIVHPDIALNLSRKGADHLKQDIQLKDTGRDSASYSSMQVNEITAHVEDRELFGIMFPASITTSPSHINALTVTNIIEPSNMEYKKSRAGSPGRLEVSCQCVDEIKGDGRFNGGYRNDVREKAHRETPCTDGLSSSPPTDTDDPCHRDLNLIAAELSKPIQQEFDYVYKNILCDTKEGDQISIVTTQDQSENDSVREKNEVLSELDVIVKRLSQLQSLQPRPSLKLPKATLPVLAACFSSFNATSKRVRIGF